MQRASPAFSQVPAPAHPYAHALAHARSVAFAVAVAVALGAAGASSVRAQGGDLDPAAPDAEEGESPSSDRRDAEARQVFEAGRMALEDGRYEDALQYFERSYALSGRAALLFNIGSVAERLRRDERALEAYRAYLEAEPGVSNRMEVERRISILEEALARQEALAASPATSESSATGGGSLLEEWWFWTILGAVVVGAVVTVAVVAASGTDVEQPLPGRDGAVVTALRW